MTGPQTGGAGRFGPEELDDVAGIRPDELAAETRLARDLESVAARGTVGQTVGFADRVMAAVAAEPVPAPMRAARVALRRGAFIGFLVSVRDAWRVTFSGGFPVAVRAQALALVLVVTGIAAGTGLAAAGAAGLFEGNHASPGPSLVAPTPPHDGVTPAPLSTTTPGNIEPNPTTGPAGSLEPADSGAPESEPPGSTAEPDEGGGNSTGSGVAPAAGATRRPQDTPDPASAGSGEDQPETPGPAETGRPGHTPEPSHAPSSQDGHPSGG
jgi:hypothetical protein